MKNLSLFVSAFALCASTSYAAINCSTLPSCDSLGYTDTVADCPKVYNWNASSKKLVATTTPKAVICPFDMAKGRCLHDAKVGDLKYSLHAVNHEGWILCNGQSLDTTTYSALYNVIGSNYGMDGTKFRVPDYRGFFLRAYGAADKNNALSSFGGSANTSLNTPQKEQLPNITGYGNGFIKNVRTPVVNTGAFSSDKVFQVSKAATENRAYNDNTSKTGWWNDYIEVEFNASKSSSIYQTNGHVIPANYAANIFIYAGK